MYYDLDKGQSMGTTSFSYQMHRFLVRTLYRVIAPRHPRGWTDLHAVIEEDCDPKTLWIHTHGMERWSLANFEIVGVPYDLGGYAHGILFDLMGYAKTEKPVGANESFGGMLVDRNQRLTELATFRLMRRDEPGHEEFHRVVDLDEPLESGFPRRLFAAHMIAMADTIRNAERRQALFLRTIQIYPGSRGAEVPDDEFDRRSNANNFVGWEGVSDSLIEQGRINEGLECLKQAIIRCPNWARSFSKMYREEIAPQHPDLASDARAEFWVTLDLDKLLVETAERSGIGPT